MTASKSRWTFPGFAICHQRGADNGKLDVQGHGRLHHIEMELMKREASWQNLWKLMEESLPRLSIVAKTILYVNATSTSSKSAFSWRVVSLRLSSMQSRAITPANQLDAILFLNQNRASLFNMHHPRVVFESRW